MSPPLSFYDHLCSQRKICRVVVTLIKKHNTLCHLGIPFSATFALVFHASTYMTVVEGSIALLLLLCKI